MIAETTTINQQQVTAMLIVDDGAGQMVADMTRANAGLLNAELATWPNCSEWQWIIIDDVYRVFHVGVGEVAEYYANVNGDIVTLDRDTYFMIIDLADFHPDGADGWARHEPAVYDCWDCRVDEYLMHCEVAA